MVHSQRLAQQLALARHPAVWRRAQMRAAAPLAASGAERPGAQLPDAPPRVLSIQSHVVHGHVGNRCAVFALQRLGFEVDAINTVQFSNHTGYPCVKGTVLQGDELWTLLEGLISNGLGVYDYVVTGYIGSLTVMDTIVRVVQRLREVNPGLRYHCDPVMGDNGRLYVPEGCMEGFRDRVLQLATVVTPNQFEAQLLFGKEVRNETDALAACDALHAMGPRTVVITSMSPSEGDDDITIIGSTTEPQLESVPSRVRLRLKKLPGYFTGTGDLLAALLVAKLHCHQGRFAAALEEAVAALQGVMAVTADAQGGIAADDRSAEAFRARELRVVQGQYLLEHPEVVHRAEPVGG